MQGLSLKPSKHETPYCLLDPFSSPTSPIPHSDSYQVLPKSHLLLAINCAHLAKDHSFYATQQSLLTPTSPDFGPHHPSSPKPHPSKMFKSNKDGQPPSYPQPVHQDAGPYYGGPGSAPPPGQNMYGQPNQYGAPGQQQEYYGGPPPPQGGHYGGGGPGPQQQMNYGPPMQQQGGPGYNQNGGRKPGGIARGGFCAALMGALACCCCLDCLF